MRRGTPRDIGVYEDYIRLLNESPQEAQTLVNDFLINVTSFFRDPEAFEALAGKIEDLLVRKGGEEGRIWAEAKVDEGACSFFSLPTPGG